MSIIGAIGFDDRQRVKLKYVFNQLVARVCRKWSQGKRRSPDRERVIECLVRRSSGKSRVIGYLPRTSSNKSS